MELQDIIKSKKKDETLENIEKQKIEKNGNKIASKGFLKPGMAIQNLLISN
jgi:hypothetical protein